MDLRVEEELTDLEALAKTNPSAAVAKLGPTWEEWRALRLELTDSQVMRFVQLEVWVDARNAETERAG